MRIRLPIMIQDPKLSGYPQLKRIVERPYVHEDSFADGPACPRVAVVDRDPATGAARPGVPFEPPKTGRTLWRYAIADEKDIYAPDFMAVNVFGTVLRTMGMFEEEDTLGRRLVWGFDGPQLLVNPRAGLRANAHYQRAFGRLQFFYFDNPNRPGETVYTALSRDIISHETGHAILDGIAPQLLEAATPQSLALHEAIADLVAVVMSFRSRNLCAAILKETQGSIANVGAFSAIGEEFGMALYNLGSLRDLRNQLRMDDVDHAKPHALSQVLSAALYNMIIGMHQRWWQKFSGAGLDLDYSASGKALAIAADQFKRMVFRALDYLPPAEVSFADYGRAVIAADQASHPDDDQERQFIREEFVQRGIVADPVALDVKTDFEHAAVKALDLDALVADDAVAVDFVEHNRNLLHVPSDVHVHIAPRLDVTKLYYHRNGQKRRVRECLFKVWWTQLEPNPIGSGWPKMREVRVGTTLAIDWKTQRVRALLTTDPGQRPEEAESQRLDRNLFLQRLAEVNLLQTGTAAPGRYDATLPSVVPVDTSGDVLRVRSTEGLLHME